MLVLTNARVFDGTEMLPGTHDVALDGNRIASIDDRGTVAPTVGTTSSTSAG